MAIHTAGDAAETMSLHALEDPAYTMLHYESPNGDQFVRKWRALLASGGSVGQRMVRRRFGNEVDAPEPTLGLPDEETTARLEHLYQEHVADDVETLRRLNLLQHHDPDTWTHNPEPIPHSEARRWAEAVAQMRRAPKSSYLPPTRRDAPLEPDPEENWSLWSWTPTHRVRAPARALDFECAMRTARAKVAGCPATSASNSIWGTTTPPCHRQRR